MDPVLREKMMHAFLLVDQLASAQLTFTFKGGTSVGLICGRIDRFSIDVDIITSATRAELETALNSVTEGPNFHRYELDAKRSYLAGIPKAHYKIYFASSHQGSGHVVLDAVFTPWNYPEVRSSLVQNPINSEYFTSRINLPSISGLLGDKLTALAPNTVGIPYSKGGTSRSLEIIKQLYDLNTLINFDYEHNIVHQTYREITLRELQFRDSKSHIDDCLEDTIRVCINLASRGKFEHETHRFSELQLGIKALNSGYLIHSSFRIEDAILAAGRVARLAASLRSSPLNLPEYPWPFLVKLSKTSLEAQHTWQQFWDTARSHPTSKS
jgi:hypothetical protein